MSVPFDWVQARAKVAMSRDKRCRCGAKAIPGEVRGGRVIMTIQGDPVRSRSWIPCERCLGTIRQVG